MSGTFLCKCDAVISKPQYENVDDLNKQATGDTRMKMGCQMEMTGTTTQSSPLVSPLSARKVV